MRQVYFYKIVLRIQPQAPFSVIEVDLFWDDNLSKIFVGDHREGVTPDPISNSEVKPFFADGTTHKSVGE